RHDRKIVRDIIDHDDDDVGLRCSSSRDESCRYRSEECLHKSGSRLTREGEPSPGYIRRTATDQKPGLGAAAYRVLSASLRPGFRRSSSSCRMSASDPLAIAMLRQELRRAELAEIGQRAA